MHRQHLQPFLNKMRLPLDFGRITPFIAFCQLAWMPEAWNHSANKMWENRSWFSFPACSLSFVLVTPYPFIPILITLNFSQLPHLQYRPGCLYDFRLKRIKLGMRMIKLTCSDKYGSVKVHGWLPSSLYFVGWVNSSNQAYFLCGTIPTTVKCTRMYSDLTTDTSTHCCEAHVCACTLT